MTSRIPRILVTIFCAAGFSAYSADEWTPIGTTDTGYSVFATQGEHQSDGSVRMFVKAEKKMERKPEGLLAMFSKPEKYVEKVAPFAILVHCKKRAVRKYVAGNFGEEFYEPWEPATPGTVGALALSAFCKH